MIEYINTIKQYSNIAPKNILEIGSRDGIDAEILRSAFNISNDNVWVVEPNPKQQSKIEIEYPNFNLVKKAIYNKETEIFFYAVEEPSLVGVSSILSRNDNLYNTINTKKIIVETITGRKLIETIGSDIDLCKIDVEGVTFEVLESFEESIMNIKSMHIESEHSQVWDSQKLYKEIAIFLEANNFVQKYFKYVNNVILQSDSIWINKNYLKN